MRSFLLSSAAAFAGLATAKIGGVAGPAVIAPSDEITVTLLTENYIQSVKDISVAFGLAPQVYSGGFLGVDYLGSFYLGPEKSNTLKNLTFSVKTPSNIAADKFLIASVNSLYGASNGAVTIEYYVPFTPGAKTSAKQVSSHDQINGNCFQTPNQRRSSNKQRQASCFPTQTESIISRSIELAESTAQNIQAGANSTARQNLGELHGYLGDLQRAVGVTCDNGPTPAWPTHLTPADSKARAVDILRNAEGALGAVKNDVESCDKEGAKSVTCQADRLVDQIDGYFAA